MKAASCLGQKGATSGFIPTSVGNGLSRESSRRYKCWKGRSTQDLPVHNLAPLTTSSFSTIATLFRCSTVTVPLSHVPLSRCSTVPIFHCAAVLLCHCSPEPIFHCAAVLLSHCFTEQLFHCATVPRSTLPLFYCSSVTLCHCFTVLQCHSSTLPLCHFSTVPLLH